MICIPILISKGTKRHFFSYSMYFTCFLPLVNSVFLPPQCACSCKWRDVYSKLVYFIDISRWHKQTRKSKTFSCTWQHLEWKAISKIYSNVLDNLKNVRLMFGSQWATKTNNGLECGFRSSHRLQCRSTMFKHRCGPTETRRLIGEEIGSDT